MDCFSSTVDFSVPLWLIVNRWRIESSIETNRIAGRMNKLQLFISFLQLSEDISVQVAAVD